LQVDNIIFSKFFKHYTQEQTIFIVLSKKVENN